MILSLVQQEIEIRKKRKKHITDEIFGEPAWDLLLDLYVAAAHDRRLTTEDVVTRTGTSARWITVLEDRRLAERRHNEGGAKFEWINITPDGILSLQAIFTSELGA